MQRAPIEQFPALLGIAGTVHAFTKRVPGLDVAVDRELALARLDEHHAAVRRALGLESKHLITAAQVHGAKVAVVNANTPVPVPEVDGLITDDPRACLGIYVADCCAVYLVDPVRRVIALLHSGKKGTEQGIALVALQKMQAEFGCEPGRMIAQLSPCIRPPHYEVDFAAVIAGQLRNGGIRQVHDTGVCTACETSTYYSYRREMGKTGRMLALFALTD